MKSRPSLPQQTLALSPSAIAPMVHWIRHEKVILDSDLAALYGVEIRALNQAVKRNRDRFPEDFMFQLSGEDAAGLRGQSGSSETTLPGNSPQSVTSAALRSQTVTLKPGRGRHRKYLPYAFTEQGVAMLSSVLRSERAIAVNIAIMRTFVQLRRLMDSNRDLARKIDALETKYDAQFRVVFDAIKRLIAEDRARKAKPRREIGFHAVQR